MSTDSAAREGLTTKRSVQWSYPEVAFGGFTRVDGTVAFCSRVQALVSANATVLDVGCGRGARVRDECEYRRKLQCFQGSGRHVIGIDVDANAAANPFVDEFRLIKNVERWPVESASVDLLYCDYVLEHIDEPSAFFAEAWRVLKPGGHACMRTPNKWGYVAMVARIMPNRLHASVVGFALRGRRDQVDVFPTRYRANTTHAIRLALEQLGFEVCVYYCDAEPSYLDFSPLLYRIGAHITPWIPPWFRSSLVAFARKSR